MQSLYKSLFIFLAMVALSACTSDFDEINSNPNAPEVVSGDLLLPSIIIDPAREYLERDAWELGNTAMQIGAVNNFTTFDQMGWGGNDGVWNVFYRAMRDAKNLMTIADETGNDAYKGIALVMQSWLVSILTNKFGDVPFTEAIQAKDGNFTPKYDTQESIYNAILSDLATADDLLASGGAVSGDLLFDGDLMKWRRFSNSLRIRHLMRLENKRGGSAIGAEIQSILSSKPVFESNGDNASIPFLNTAPNQYFMHTARVGGFDEHRMSQRAELRMKSINDPRLFTYYRPIDNPDSLAFYLGDLSTLGSSPTKFKDFFLGEYTKDPEAVQKYYPLFKGLPNGLSEGNAINYNGSRQNQARLGEILRELPNGVGMNFMTYPELQFILAEAAQKGYISGDVETYYLNGVNAAFEMYDLTPATSYFEQGAVKLSADMETALDQIAIQKWMALFVTGMEAYFDWRRTGRPEIAPGPDNVNNNQVPLRFTYPGAEQALNGTNWKEAIDRIGGDDEINAKMWLLQ